MNQRQQILERIPSRSRPASRCARWTKCCGRCPDDCPGEDAPEISEDQMQEELDIRDAIMEDMLDDPE
jgi:hypothetical protein